ncbi:hypothetical protein AN958_01873 [Leucoagaricus sp. SymC.cos]|nr:hypothetical protein AN958_01873 [Leucoagaricus sp. SymC.cos]
MRGPAGVGKSAIAQTCATHVKNVDRLAAAFFFSHGKHDDHTRFFTTLAYQLSTMFPEYRRILDNKVQGDRTLVNKTLLSQFKSLIVEPLQVVEGRGNTIGRRAIFIDGLDECSNKEAQCEIIEIIASSVRDGSTPFRWAIFSRPEPHIVATFTKNDVYPICRLALLPISRAVDGEIELYLRGGLENILRRRNLPLMPSWLTDEVIQQLVDASAGLFAYPATVLRFIDRYPSLLVEEPLREVLGASNHHPGQGELTRISPFAELDAFYMLILKRIPEHVLPSVQLLLADLVCGQFYGGWYAALICNKLGLSEAELRGICNHLLAVVDFQEYPRPLRFDERINTEVSYYLQESSILYNRPHAVGGMLSFHHKSFYDFLVDPNRSATFCLTTPTVREQRFHRYVQTQHAYAQTLAISKTGLGLAPNVPNSSISLSYPQGNEFIDSFIKFWVFTQTTVDLSHNGQPLLDFLERIPSSSLQMLADLDYRKYLLAEITVTGLGLWEGHSILGTRGLDRVTPSALFSSLPSTRFEAFDCDAFLRMVDKFEKSGIVKPYHPKLPSRVASVYRAFSRRPSEGKFFCGQYKLGRGEKAIYWYWEFDTEQRYFREFDTLDFMEAMRIYQAAKEDLWTPSWTSPP